jgi:hypothetical protein
MFKIFVEVRVFEIAWVDCEQARVVIIVFGLLTVEKHLGLNTNKHRAEEVALRYSYLFEFLDSVLCLAISADVNSSPSSVDNDNTFTILHISG